MSSSLSSITKTIQEAVGVKADGIWGTKTATAVWNYIQLAQVDEDEIVESAESNLNASSTTTSDQPTSKYALISDEVHRKCIEVLHVFETGKKEGDYSNVSIYKDGGGGSYKQITYGASQTTQDGNLDKLLYAYLAKHTGTAAASVISSRMPTKNNRDLVNDTEFINALKSAGKEEIMQEAQDEFFDETYFSPAYNWFKNNGFTLPLSMLVIYDSYIHSGGILTFLRNRFKEVPPASGGDEKTWIEQYVSTRKSWLANHSNKILRNTVYRMKTMQDCIDNNNWDLTKPINANGVIIS